MSSYSDLTREQKGLLETAVTMTIDDLHRVIRESNDPVDQEWAKVRIEQYEEIIKKLDLLEG